MKKIAFTFFFLGSLIVSSCNKPSDVFPISIESFAYSDDKIAIAKAQEWYNESSSNARVKDSNHNKLPVWQLAKTVPLKGGDKLVVIPLWMSNPNFQFDKKVNHMRRLSIILNEDNSVKKGMVTEIITYNKTWRNQPVPKMIQDVLLNKSVKGFSGAILFSSLSDSQLESYAFKNGDIVSTKLRITNPRNGRVAYCYESILETTYSDGTVTWELLGTYCSEGATNGENNEMLPPDYHGPLYGDPDPNDVLTKITNQVQNPCIKISVDRALYSNCNRITDLINSVFGNNDQVNLKFRDEDLFSNDLYGFADITNDIQGLGGRQIEATVTINTRLSQYSQEIQTLTAYHEALHAYLSVTQEAQDGYEQHNVMAESFVDWISTNMRIAYPQMSKRDADGLALIGLDDHPKLYTEIMQKYGFTSKSDLNSTIDGYAGGSDKKGTYCE